MMQNLGRLPRGKEHPIQFLRNLQASNPLSCLPTQFHLQNGAPCQQKARSQRRPCHWHYHLWIQVH
uniref:Uncharacterized protein n=1 Tax=Arundo donax TaxID=35708 RepID=A0A0A9DH61_ARUDO